MTYIFAHFSRVLKSGGNCFQKTISLQLTSKVIRRRMEHSDSESTPLNAVILHHDEIRKKEPRGTLRARKQEPSSKVQMHSERSKEKVGAGKDTKNITRREHCLQRPVPLPKDEENVSTTMFAFTLDRQKRSRSVSDLILKQRIRLYFKEDNKEVDTRSSEEIQQGEIAPQRRRLHRYFDKLILDDTRKPIKCYRCGKTGHISSRCIQEKSQVKCYFCTKNHHCKLCSSAILCNQCGEINHIEYECNEGDKERCRRCRKKGHKESACGVIMFQRATKESRLDNLKEYDLGAAFPGDRERMRCLNTCQAFQGHFRCYSINLDKDQPYEGDQYAFKYDTNEHTRAQPVELENY